MSAKQIVVRLEINKVDSNFDEFAELANQLIDTVNKLKEFEFEVVIDVKQEIIEKEEINNG